MRYLRKLSPTPQKRAENRKKPETRKPDACTYAVDVVTYAIVLILVHRSNKISQRSSYSHYSHIEAPRYQLGVVGFSVKGK